MYMDDIKLLKKWKRKGNPNSDNNNTQPKCRNDFSIEKIPWLPNQESSRTLGEKGNYKYVKI